MVQKSVFLPLPPSPASLFPLSFLPKWVLRALMACVHVTRAERSQPSFSLHLQSHIVPHLITTVKNGCCQETNTDEGAQLETWYHSRWERDKSEIHPICRITRIPAVGKLKTEQRESWGRPQLLCSVCACGNWERKVRNHRERGMSPWLFSVENVKCVLLKFPSLHVSISWTF